MQPTNRIRLDGAVIGEIIYWLTASLSMWECHKSSHLDVQMEGAVDEIENDQIRCLQIRTRVVMMCDLWSNAKDKYT